ncbi:MAG TPA: DUF2336 domain-containing protein [Roseiarcus sp.]
MHLKLPTTKLLPAPSCAKPDIVRRFLAWAQSADADARAEGASALARAYLYSELTASVRAEAALAMTALTDDPSVLVRRALADALCRAHDAPRTVILALAADEPEAAAAVLQYSPVLTDADLVECVRNGDSPAHMTLAGRPKLGRQAAAALAEVGQRDVVLALIANLDIDLPAELLHGVLTRFDDDPRVRDALLERASLPAALRARIAVVAAKDLAVEASQWMAPERAERIAREARDQAISAIASSCRPDERAELTRALRMSGALTPALLLRSLLGGRYELFAASMAELSGLPPPRVAAFILEPQGQGFASLARRAGLKDGVLPAFRAALAALKIHGGESGDELKLKLVQKVIDECERRNDPALAKVLALLWRFAAEAAKAEAASFAREAAGSASGGRLPPILDFSPVNDDEVRAPKLLADFSRAPTSAPPTNPREDQAPCVELPPKLVARLDNAA